MRRFGRAVVLGSPWVALGLIAWRQQSLEKAMSEFAATTNKVIQTAVDTMFTQIEQALQAVVDRGGSMN